MIKLKFANILLNGCSFTTLDNRYIMIKKEKEENEKIKYNNNKYYKKVYLNDIIPTSVQQ